MRARELQVADISSTFRSVGDAIQHAIGLMNAALAKARYPTPKGSTLAYLEMRRDLPYVVHATMIPGVQIILNRDYKPLGFPGRGSDAYVNYEERQTTHVRLSLVQITSIASPGRDGFFFGDDNPPWNSRKDALAYLHRIERLGSLT